ncbi:hypothetical protein [Cynomolgus macaque cytomegalovirus strain Mauritius]|uniref:Uncharacterized protein n=1 Tax=Cynomolgus macaque cytomegalovirus strain Mauritius TaxID=1690255 RepID=A0A0K1H0F2_9BETA|nr:hypothetical protein [Cynomolgus macaque cytomegalovirus strain Mauritius]
MRFQSLNQYRKRFRLKPYESFEELTGDSYYIFNSLFYLFLSIQYGCKMC